MLAGYLQSGTNIPITSGTPLPVSSISSPLAALTLANPVQLAIVYLHR